MAVVLGAMGSLAPKLLQLLHSEYKLQTSVKKKVEFVLQELESIQAALDKVAAVPWDQLDMQVKIWARQVREASYDMEDVLDTFLIRVKGGEPANRSRLERNINKMGDLCGKFKARRDIACAVDDIKKQLQEVADRRARNRIDEIVANPTPATALDPRLSAFYTKASQLVGINEPRDTLIEMLSIGEDDASFTEMKIISIVGFGGLGKTTLAKAVHDKVNHQFDCGAFVPVGRNPDPRKVLREILIDLINDEERRKITGNHDKITGIVDYKGYTGTDLMGLDERLLINQLHRFLEGKRYFIVIDDIWDLNTWNIIKIAFVDSNSRSRIIATTRNSHVSEEIGKVYRMEKLPESQSRKLLYTRTFGTEEKWPDNDDVAVVSQKILHKCDGVPLTIITIASLLAEKQIEEWSNVYESVGFGHGDDTQVNNMKKILSFSYYDLPSHLRTCMLYLSVFPEDYFVHRAKLIWMWIAEGLVQTEEAKEPFEVGESYFMELINRGMIQPMEICGILRGCRVHDMVLHMIRDFSREENFVVVQNNVQGSQQGSDVRRLALDNGKPIQVNDIDMQKVRSLNAMYCGTDIIAPVSGFKLLRVLSLVNCRPLEGCYLDTEHLGKLHHLRYLGLDGTPVRELPRDIGHHLNLLQTLMLTGTGIEELPKSLGQLRKLMCLRADVKTRVPDWIGELTSLVELQMYVAAGDKCFLKELGKLTDLRELETGITLQDEGQVREFLLALSNLQKMELMTIQTLSSFACKDAIMQPSFVVLCCNNLRVLRLDPLELSRLPKWINPQALPKLCTLRLNLSVLYQQDMDVLGKFNKLFCLSLQVVDWSENISISGGGRFQNLKHFKSNGLQQLEFIQGAMPKLEDISLRIYVRLIKNNDDFSLDLGLGNLSALRQFSAYIDCVDCLPTEVAEVEADLRHAISLYPSHPTLQISRIFEDKMVTSSDYSTTEWYKRRSRLDHLQGVYVAVWKDADKMRKMKTDLNLIDAKNKVEEFFEQFSATGRFVLHIQGQACVEDGTPINDGDLNQVTRGKAALEQASEILTVEYPRFAAMLDELRYGFSLQGAMQPLEVINLNIVVFDVVDKLGGRPLEFGLLGKKISSLQRIRAHVNCLFCFPTEVEVEEVEAELRHAIDTHHPNNPPTLKIIRYCQDKMVNSDSDSQMSKGQIRGRRLYGRIQHQMELYNTLHLNAVKMHELINDMNPNDDAKQKEQRFHEHINATRGRVQHELLLLFENIRACDLERVRQGIAGLEEALEILTVEYPRLAAMLEEMRTALITSQRKDDDEKDDRVNEDDEVSAAASSSDREGEGEVVEAVVSFSSLAI